MRQIDRSGRTIPKLLTPMLYHHDPASSCETWSRRGSFTVPQYFAKLNACEIHIWISATGVCSNIYKYKLNVIDIFKSLSLSLTLSLSPNLSEQICNLFERLTNLSERIFICSNNKLIRSNDLLIHNWPLFKAVLLQCESKRNL